MSGNASVEFVPARSCVLRQWSDVGRVMKFPLSLPPRAALGKTLRPMLERFAFVCHLALLVGACGLIGLGLIFAFFMGEVRPLCVGLAGGALSRILYKQGYREWNFRRWEESFEPSDRDRALVFDSARAERSGELLHVLRDLAALEEDETHRDVWAIQELRQRVRSLLESEPALRREFAGELAKYPEIG
jgi:hypothetical protein